MTHKAEAAGGSGASKIYWKKKCFYTVLAIWVLGSILLTLTAGFTRDTEASSVRVFPPVADTTPWYIMTAFAILLAGAVVWLACNRLFARPNEALEEIRESLAQVQSMAQDPPFDD